MKTIKSIRPFLCASVCAPALSGTPLLAGSLEIEPVADAVVLQAEPDSNRGNDGAIWAYSGPNGDTGDAAKSYISFRLPAGSFDAARFVGLYTAKRDRGAEIWMLEDGANWDEASITWNNAPGNDTSSSYLLAGSALRIGDIGGKGPGNETELVFADANAESLFLDALNERAGKTITLVIVQKPYAQASTFTLASKENPAHTPPRLILETRD
ncbi:MAG: DNRLRE domain-containing protein [Chthoniobacterales bacterium]|nr:DNRLRE domain-containing protein [Chthoniobacterales bacterium]